LDGSLCQSAAANTPASRQVPSEGASGTTRSPGCRADTCSAGAPKPGCEGVCVARVGCAPTAQHNDNAQPARRRATQGADEACARHTGPPACRPRPHAPRPQSLAQLLVAAAPVHRSRRCGASCQGVTQGVLPRLQRASALRTSGYRPWTALMSDGLMGAWARGKKRGGKRVGKCAAGSGRVCQRVLEHRGGASGSAPYVRTCWWCACSCTAAHTPSTPTQHTRRTHRQHLERNVGLAQLVRQLLLGQPQHL
jgi:hypothetical protein